jgi:hypothetical protein
MKKTLSALLPIIVLLATLSGCKKSSSSTPPPGPPPPPTGGTVKCFLLKDSLMSSKLGNSYFTYEYDKTTRDITRMKNYITIYNILQDDWQASSGFVNWDIYESNAKKYGWGTNLAYTSNKVVDADRFFHEYVNGVTFTTHWGGYSFRYDGKGRLSEVIMGTLITTDWEYTLHISYNDKDNVNTLRYETTTGPRGDVYNSVLEYDDKPNPYTYANNIEFIMQNWNSSQSAEFLSVALGRNNPLKIKYSDGWTVDLSYTYNDKGFPTTRTAVHKDRNGMNEYTTTNVYTYECE